MIILACVSAMYTSSLTARSCSIRARCLDITSKSSRNPTLAIRPDILSTWRRRSHTSVTAYEHTNTSAPSGRCSRIPSRILKELQRSMRMLGISINKSTPDMQGYRGLKLNKLFGP